MGPQREQRLNPYAQIIVDEALRRGIAAEVIDAEQGYFALQYGGRKIICRESLSELTSAVAMSRCDNKIVTHRVARGCDIKVPAQRPAGDSAQNLAFLAQHGAVVVKPVRGEQGRGISVNIRSATDLEHAVEQAHGVCPDALLEQYVPGEDLRVVLIDFEVVAAAVRRPASVCGNGHHTIRELIQKQSRRRAAATGGESRIPIDEETARCIRQRGYELDHVLANRERLQVRETANLHTGGTLHDVTAQLSPALRDASQRIARALDIPVVGLDLIVDSAAGERYVLIEANERPGLANHEPQPTAERFVDLLFPQTVAAENA
jgi:GNAT-family acetyltransferase (TIGR03103 family)